MRLYLLVLVLALYHWLDETYLEKFQWRVLDGIHHCTVGTARYIDIRSWKSLSQDARPVGD